MNPGLRFTQRFAAAIAIFSTLFCARADEPWHPANGPLKTKWAADVNPSKAHPEYPRPQLVRKDWMNLNGLWDYTVVPISTNTPTKYQGQILVPFPIDSALSGVMRRLEETNQLCYRRRVTIPAEWRGRHVRLHFGAVDWEARVSVNGRLAGQHQGGYDHFSFDITDQLLWKGDEEIVVTV